MEIKLDDLLPLLNFLWLPVVFVANKISARNKELKDYIDGKIKTVKENIDEQVRIASERIALIDTAVQELQKSTQRTVDEKFVRDLYESKFGREIDPIKQDVKEVVIAINKAVREFDEKVHSLALDIAKNERGRVTND